MRNFYKIGRFLINVLGIACIWFGISICTEASSVPKILVEYEGIINVMEERSSPENINKKLKSNGLKIRSSDNEVFMKEENAINIHVKINHSQFNEKEDEKNDVEENRLEKNEPEGDKIWGNRTEFNNTDDSEIREEGTEERPDEKIDNFNPEDLKIELYCIQYDEKGTEKKELIEERELEEKEVIEDNNQKEFLCSIQNLTEGHYKVLIKYEGEEKTEVFLSAEENEETAACMKNGYYESPVCTVDMETPVVKEVFCSQNAIRKIGKRQYFCKIPKFIIRIQEENFNKTNFCLEGKMFYADGTKMKERWKRLEKKIEESRWSTYYKDGVRINEVSIEADEEANYLLSFQSTDGSGHISNLKEIEFTYDCTKPQITYTGMDNTSGDLIFKVADAGVSNSSLRFHKYRFFRYFSSEKMLVSVRVRDDISGVEKVKYDFVPYDKDSNGESGLSYSRRALAEKEKSRDSREINKGTLSEMIVLVSPEQKNFKGYLKVYGQDYSGNSGDIVETKGAVSESTQLHKKVSDIFIKITKPFFTDKEKNISYYNKNISIYASFEDKQSGLYKTSLYAGKDIGNSTMWDDETISYQREQRLTLNQEEFIQSGNGEPLEVEGKMEDNAGHIDQRTLDNKIVIDTVKPEIKVTYDKNNEVRCYKTSRKATVEIKEQNFDSDLVKWDIQGSNEKYHIGEWKIVKGVHICEVDFEEEGEDYAINLMVTDLAGNQSEWKEKNGFSVDKTAPQISVDLESVVSDLKETANGLNSNKEKWEEDFNNKVTDMKYFNHKQVAVFCIKDKNFDESKIEYNIEMTDGKKKINMEGPDQYVKKGDKYYGRVNLEREAIYHIAVKCTDKAGNESEMKELREFVIDTTAPKLVVTGVKNNGLYEGETVKPKVLCKDENLNKDTVKFRLCKANGNEVTEKEWGYEQTDKVDTVQRQWDNLENKRERDGIYQLFIEASDKAGNKLKSNFKIIFRVNRWGAKFILDDAVKQELDQYYLKEAPTIILREQSVKPTKSRVIILKDNENRSTLNLRTVKQYVIADKTSPKYGWYEKLYNIEQKNFEKEGDYQISFQSDSKEKRIRFIVDKTPPAVSIGNLEEEIYEKTEHEFTISVMDNYAFDRLELYIEESGGVGKPKNVDKRVIKSEDLDENYTVREKLIRSGKKQTIRYVAWDKAGNKTDSEASGDTRRCYVTENESLKGYYKHAKTSGRNQGEKSVNQGKGITKTAGVSLLGLSIVCAGGYILVKKKENSAKEKGCKEEHI